MASGARLAASTALRPRARTLASPAAAVGVVEAATTLCIRARRRSVSVEMGKERPADAPMGLARPSSAL
eukprot:4664282-Pleurochrysis_carterae.AAC.2